MNRKKTNNTAPLRWWQSLGNGVTWAAVTIGVGLIQLWIDLASRLFNEPTKPALFESIKDGALLFGLATVIVGLAYDFYIDSGKLISAGRLVKISFFLLPTIVLIFSLCCYFISKGQLGDVQRKLFMELNFYFSVLCVLFTVGAKSYLYHD